MGNWHYYTAVVPIEEIAQRVRYAEEIHTNTGLSNMIQRKLSGKRAGEIHRYLTEREDRFFNSLVVAFYDGPPTWFSGTVRPLIDPKGVEEFDIEDIRESGSCLGILHLSGNEKLFALDGQHRLSGIKLAYKKGDLCYKDAVPVIFVGHDNTPKGIKRSRVIFTTLNKEAKKVGVGDIIALDENDPAAIVTRMLVENGTKFSGAKVAYKQTESINPETDKACLTTIANIYYSLLNIFSLFYYDGKSTRDIASLSRPSDDVINELFSVALKFFDKLGVYFPPFGEALAFEGDITPIISVNRGRTGGHLLFRPVGITIVTRLVCQVKRNNPKSNINYCIKKVSNIPTQLNQAPYKHVLWDPRTKKMRPKGKNVIIDLLAEQIGVSGGRSLSRSISEYQDLTGSRWDA
jgi:DNA sulfur modification protein DndB